MKRFLSGVAVSTSLAVPTAALAQDEAPPPRKPLMQLLEEAGLADDLDAVGINIFGHVEGSYTYNFDKPAGGINIGRVFDFEHDELRLNQLNLTVERAVDVTKKQWDVGFRTEWIYGADAGLIHSNGLFDWYDGPRDPQNQFDLNQAYVDVAVPIGNGLRLRAGKWVTLMGWETINPTTVPLYSRSFLFGFAIPFTHTGVLGTYALNDQWSLDLGVIRGWEQSLEDNNDGLSYIGRVSWTGTDKKTSAYLTLITGPEQVDEESNFRTVIDAILAYAATEQLALAINGDYGIEQDLPGIGDAQWYGLAGYAAYKVNDRFTLNGRAEWFNDDDGSRGIGTSVYEVTLGVTVTPFPNDTIGSNFKVRPEIRWDFADDEIFDGGTDDSQFTLALDAYFTF